MFTGRAQNGVFWEGAKKFMLKKCMCFVWPLGKESKLFLGGPKKFGSLKFARNRQESATFRGGDGGVEKSEGWKTSRMTPLTKGVLGPPLVRHVFHSPSGVSALFVLYKSPRQSRPEALLEGSKSFRESAFSGTFSSPQTFCPPPPYHGPTLSCNAAPQC